MPESLPFDLEQFVQGQLAMGAYPSRGDLLADAVRRLRDTRWRLDRIRERAQRGADEIERGEAIEIPDDDALASFFDDIEAEVDREIAQQKGGE